MGAEVEFEQRCAALLTELGLNDAGHPIEVTRLTGGVASDIALVSIGTQKLCVKFSLPQLKVAEVWHAPIERNQAEYAWLRFAGKTAPESTARLYGCSEALHGFAMEYLEGESVFLWKAALLDGRIEEAQASAVGVVLGRLHAASSGQDFDTAPFQNRDDFRTLRIDPYLSFTAEKWPSLAAPLNALAQMLYSNSQILIHGDVSPKNILFKDAQPILLDAECATMGDAAFDPAFCMNHLILKALYRPKERADFLSAAHTLWRAYAAHISWEPKAALEARIARLLPALMLARVDGKSPVEYFTQAHRDAMRKITVPLIENRHSGIESLLQQITALMRKFG